MAAKEQSVAEAADGQETPNQKEVTYYEMLEHVTRCACCQKGGLVIPITWRGFRQVKEAKVLGPSTKITVTPKASGDFILTVDDEAFVTDQRQATASVIQAANEFASSGGGGIFRFPSGVGFKAIRSAA